MLVDSHCHLNFPDFNEDWPEVIERAQKNGVKTFLTISTTISAFSEIAHTAARHQDIYASVGVHPCHAHEEGFFSWEKIAALCLGKKVVAIGETGLDYHYPDTDKDKQKLNFIEHIKASQHTQLPLIVHTRDADADTIEILSQHMAEKPFPCLIHCFTASSWFAAKALELGCYISVSGIISFKNALDLRSAVKEIPLERLLVETDSPYLAPVPFRGKRNEPSFVKHVAEALADLKEISYGEVVRTTGENFYRLFNKVEKP